MAKKYRDARTGEYTTKKYAEKHKSTTFSETRKTKLYGCPSCGAEKPRVRGKCPVCGYKG